METNAKMLYNVYANKWSEIGIFKGPPAISKGLSEFLRECANHIYWQEAYKHPESDEWNKFRDMLDNLADEIENEFS